MKLTDKEKKILFQAELAANEEVSVLSKKIRIQEHSFRYGLESLKKDGVIERKVPIIDISALGFSSLTIFFSLRAQKKTDNKKIKNYFLKSPWVSMFSELGGEFQFGATIVGRNIFDISDYVESIASELGCFIFNKAITTRRRVWLFSRGYLGAKLTSKKILLFGRGEAKSKLDIYDEEILSALANINYSSFRDLARKIDVPHSTLQGRVNKLNSADILIGFRYHVNPEVYLAQSYKILLFAKSIDKQFSEKLRLFGQKHKNIQALIECLGAWDYELDVEVFNAKEVSLIVEELLRLYEDNLDSIKVLPVFKTLKLTPVPSFEEFL